MQRFYETATDKNGNIFPGAIATVKIGGSSTNAAIFSDTGGLTQKANPIVTGDDGVITFCAVDGVYDIIVTDSLGVVLGRKLGVVLITPGAGGVGGLKRFSALMADGPFNIPDLVQIS